MKPKKPHDLETFSMDEKEELKRQIIASARRIQMRTRRITYTTGIAASVVLLLGFIFYPDQSQTPSIKAYAQASAVLNINDSEEVTLLLSDDRKLKMDDKIAQINYSGNGSNVTTGKGDQISQKIMDNDDVVYNTLLVPYGKRSKVKLSDGTTVWLNSGSRIVYPAFFPGKKREVFMEGEAIFDVAHQKDKPFVVVSEGQEVQVLGTVFGVTNYTDENSIHTVLKSGSVKIVYENSQGSGDTDFVKIKPGIRASYDKDTKSIRSDKVNVTDYFSWREGVLIFKSNDLPFIMNRIARYYNTPIEIKEEALTSETFSGYLDLNDDLNIVLQNIKASTNLDYTIKESKIIVNHLKQTQ